MENNNILNTLEQFAKVYNVLVNNSKVDILDYSVDVSCRGNKIYGEDFQVNYEFGNSIDRVWIRPKSITFRFDRHYHDYSSVGELLENLIRYYDACAVDETYIASVYDFDSSSATWARFVEAYKILKKNVETFANEYLGCSPDCTRFYAGYYNKDFTSYLSLGYRLDSGLEVRVTSKPNGQVVFSYYDKSNKSKEEVFNISYTY